MTTPQETDPFHYQALFDAAGLGIARLSLTGEWLETNATLCRMLGYSKSELIHHAAADITHSEDLEVDAAGLQSLIQKETKSVSLRKRYVKKNSDIIWVNQSVHLVVTEQGSPDYLVLVVYPTQSTPSRQAQDATDKEKRALQIKANKESQLAQHYLDIAGNMIIALNTKAEVTLINQQGLSILAAKESEVIGKNWFDHFIFADELSTVKSWFNELMAGKVDNVRYAENFVKTIDGKQRLIAWYNTLTYDDTGHITGLLSSGTDITETKAMQEEIQSQKERFELAIEGTNDGLWDWNLLTNKAYHSRRFETMLGYDGNELSDTVEAWSGLIHPEDQAAAFTAVEEYLASGGTTSYENTFRMKTKDGQWRWITGRGKATFDENGQPTRLVGFNTDVTNDIERRKELEFASKHDPLTLLANRFLLNELLQKAIDGAKRKTAKLAVLYIDLDGFKSVNDQFGHQAGDQVLQTTAERILSISRQEDIVSRLGGDEFVIVLTELDTGLDVLSYTNRLLEALSADIYLEQTSSQNQIQVSASVGISLCDHQSDKGSESFIREADLAMYEAKKLGKNQFRFFDPQNDLATKTYQNMAQAITVAIEQEQFELYFQPKIDMKTGEILGFESLLRWNTPNEMLFPDDFLPVVQSNADIMRQITAWVFNNACQTLSEWQSQEKNWKISVNISSHDLHDSAFLNNIMTTLMKYPNIHPLMIEIEILETTALTNLNQTNRILSELKSHGFSIALDDFGTGYSTLAYLKELPVDTLKIDKSFVMDMTSNESSLSIVEASISLAEAFRCEVIAEGVEDEEHGEFLLQLGCRVAQGYFIAKPMPKHQITPWIQRYKSSKKWPSTTPITNLCSKAILNNLVSHRAWYQSFILRSQDEIAPNIPMNPKKCEFGKWLINPDVKHQLPSGAWAKIDEEHTALHTLALEILQTDPSNSEKKWALNTLHNRLDRLLKDLIEELS